MSDILHFVTMRFLLEGALLTLELTAYSFVLGLLGGILLAAIQLRRVVVLSALVRLIVIVLRGTPVLLQLLFVYDVLPSLGISASAFVSAIVVLALNTSSYLSEVFRGAVTSLDRGQIVAAESLGMSPLVIARRVIAPQAIRIALPSLANQVIVLILTSSLASVISVSELTLRSQELAASTFLVIAVFTAAGIMYLVLTSVVAGAELILEDLLSYDRHSSRRALLSRWGARTRRVLFQSAWLARPFTVAESTLEGEDHSDDRRESMTEMLLPEIELTLTRDALVADGISDEGGSEKEVMLEVKGVVKSYGARRVLRGVDLSVRRGQVVAVMGVSGCGKSTLLRSILRLEDFESGSIVIEGEPFGEDDHGRPLRGRMLAKARAQARIAMVFQHFELFSHMSARDNVSAAPRFVYGRDSSTAYQRADSLLDAVGLGEHVHDLPRHLSGGQQQRTAIARALGISPRVMLLDEPTSALDPLMVHEVLSVIRRLASLGMTMVIVTHELNFARDVADEVVFMHEGRIAEMGPPEEVLENPKQESTRTFLRILAH